MNKFIAMLFVFYSGLSLAEKTVTVPLSYATDKQQDIILRGQSQTVTIPISILEGQVVESIKLTLAVYNNNDIDRSVLWIAAKNRSLANIELKQRNEYQFIEMTIPPELLSKNVPKLDLRIQHQSNTPNLTVDTTALSSVISSEQSSYSLTYKESEELVEYTLTAFDEMISSGQWHDAAVNILSTMQNNPEASLSIAASLVQGWTLKSGSGEHDFDYRIMSGSKGDIEPPTIVFGVKDELLASNWINQEVYQAISGPYLGIGASNQKGGPILVVSGESEKEVKRASKVFANNIQKLPEVAQFIVTSEDEVEDQAIKSNATYPLSLFTNQIDITESPLELSLVMPSNILSSSEDTAKINLLLSHSRVSPGEGSMILRVNDKYANSLPLRSSFWRDMQHYRLNIPMRDLKPGINKVSVEVYGPVHVRDQERRFEVYMNEKSNIKLSPWVKFIPTEDHSLSPQDFLALSDNCGRDAQITLDPNDPVQLENLWHLISYVTQQTQKAMPGLLITTASTQEREFQIVFGEAKTEQNTLFSRQVPSMWESLKQRLFEFVVKTEETQTTTAFQINNSSTTSEDVGYVKHTLFKGWYRIHLLPVNEEEFSGFLISEQGKPPMGVLSERDFSNSTSQYVKAAFIGYPAGLAAFALLIIWWISAFVTRALEMRR